MSYRDAVMTLMNWMTCLPLCTLRKIHIHLPDENIGNTEKIEIYETGTKGQKIIQNPPKSYLWKYVLYISIQMHRPIQLMCLPPWFCNGLDFLSYASGNVAVPLGHTLQEETVLGVAAYSF